MSGAQDIDRIEKGLTDLFAQAVLSRSVAGWVYVPREEGGVWWMTESEFWLRLRTKDWNP